MTSLEPVPLLFRARETTRESLIEGAKQKHTQREGLYDLRIRCRGVGHSGRMGGARSMKSMWPPLAAIFLMTYLYRAGMHGALGTPLDPLLIRGPILVIFKYVTFINNFCIRYWRVTDGQRLSVHISGGSRISQRLGLQPRSIISPPPPPPRNCID